jgi:uncharacterized membrane protein
MPVRRAHKPDSAPRGNDPYDDNIKAVATMEHAAKENRTLTARISDAITAFAGSDASLRVHVAWFGGWIAANSRWWPWPPFDPFPYNILASITSVEAIFLALFVLASQNRLTREADKRAHLDLQVNLLAEREMTVVLRMLKELCEHFSVTKTVRSAEFQAAVKQTDVAELAGRVEQEIDPPLPTPKNSSGYQVKDEVSSTVEPSDAAHPRDDR